MRTPKEYSQEVLDRHEQQYQILSKFVEGEEGIEVGVGEDKALPVPIEWKGRPFDLLVQTIGQTVYLQIAPGLAGIVVGSNITKSSLNPDTQEIIQLTCEAINEMNLPQS